MSPAQPKGEVAPLDGLLPSEDAPRISNNRDFSLYVHVPYCSVRCGYCDFNTYAMDDFGDGVSRDTYVDDALAELDFAYSVLQKSGEQIRPLRSLFFGGGTPTRIPVQDLVRILHHAIELFGIEENAEVTTEANPDSVTAEDIWALAAGGFTRVSFGMQSAVPSVLKVLDRTHTPANVPKTVEWAKDAGLQVSVDLIYGTPGETLEQWRASVEAAISYQPDHISAYSLIVEEGTKLWAQIRRGEYAMPDDDLMADMYLLADRLLGNAGYHWYEVSNFSTSEQTRSRHNLAYWNNANWWGIGPGAHSHVRNTRWWNVKHPLAYAHRVRASESPAQAREQLVGEQTVFEQIMLQLRIREGVEVSFLESVFAPDVLSEKLRWLQLQGLIDAQALTEGRVVLTLQGRLLGDAVTRELTPDV